MDLNSSNKLEEYYQKFVELQEKLKTSEEQRFMLEMKFNDMVHVAKEEEQAHYKKLRAQYKKFLEEDQKRQERNERIIRNLERVEAKISILSAKTERISMFRRQYQKYLKRIANSYPETKVTDSKISRERSFIKEEPLNELQKTLFRDDYSIPDKSKALHNQESLIYEHPAVKKSLEKDRSNEEKIEILDRYLQSISSQKCRDVLNQERQAREKLTLDMPLDKILNDEFTSKSTNHATAVADDIMNSIYSRYYTKADVTPKGNKVDLPNGNIVRTDNVKKDFTLDDKAYGSSGFNEKPPNIMVEKGKRTVTFNKAENVPQFKDESKYITGCAVLEQAPTYDFPDGPNHTSSGSYLQDENKYDNFPAMTKRKQDNLKISPDYISNENNYHRDRNNDLNTDSEHSMITSQNVQNAKHCNKHESVINGVLANDHTLAGKIEFKNVSLVNDNPYINKHFENNETEVTYDSSSMIKNDVPQVVSSQEQNQENVLKNDQPRSNDELEGQFSKQIFEYESNNPVEEDKPNHQSYEQPQEYNYNDQNNPSYKTDYAEEPYQQQTRQLNTTVNEYDNQDSNEVGISRHQEIAPSNQNDELMYNNQDPSSIQYNQNHESGHSIQYDPNMQPSRYNHTDQDEIARPDKYNSTDPSVVQYDENPPYNRNDQEEIAQPDQYNSTNPSVVQYNGNPPYNRNDQGEIAQPDQYNLTDPSVVQYDETPLYNHNEQEGIAQRDQYKSTDPSVVQYDENPPYNRNDQQVNAQHGQYNLTDPSVVQYDENPPYNRNDRKEIAQPDQYNSTDPSVVQYDENPPYNRNDPEEIAQSDQYKSTDPSVVQYDENPPYNRNDQEKIAQPDQYNSTDPSVLQYDENSAHEPAQFNKPGQQREYSENDPSNQQIQYNENGQPIQYDENGQPMGFDQYGQPLMYDQNGQIVQPQYDENGQFVPQYDENGQMIVLYDHNGQQLFDNQYKDNPQYDVNGQPIMQYDENGQPIYDKNQQQYYDYPDQYQGGDQGHYIETQGALNDQNKDTGNQLQKEEENYYQVGDHVTGGIPIQEGDQYEAIAKYNQGQDNNIEAKQDIIEENKEVVQINDGKNADAAKPTNVMDILDTDTESAQQNTSKISNGSDFDFS